MARTPTRFGVTLALTAALTLAGCSGGASRHSVAKRPAATGSSVATPAGQSTARGLTLSGQWPLTGLPARGKRPNHPVMVVKIDNTDSSRPQVGLGEADLVTEELVEGGLTRLAVFFYQRVPRLVGPVRSMRASDIGIVKPAKAVVVASGAAPPTVRRIRAAGIRAFTEGAPGYLREATRPAPYNLFVRLRRLGRTVPAKATVPGYLPFGPAGAKLAGRRASGLAARFSAGRTTVWSYRRGTYVDESGFAAAGDRFRPDTVLVLRVRVGDAGYLDPAGNKVPETTFTGTGRALVFHGGRVIRGTWRKTLTSPISLRTRAGRLAVPAGRTWVELVPRVGGSVTIRR